jgi:GTP1/Obg family GTP-binding protein
MPATLTTTAAASDTVTVQGMTSTGHCSLTATNSTAAANHASTYVSAKTTNQITVAHTTTAGMTYDVLCTPN